VEKYKRDYLFIPLVCHVEEITVNARRFLAFPAIPGQQPNISDLATMAIVLIREYTPVVLCRTLP